MPTFIRRNQVQDTIQTKDGPLVIVREKNWKVSELKELMTTNPSMFFEVSESHANAVLRTQTSYQEVFDDVLAQITPPAPEPVSKPQPRRRAAQSGGNSE